MMRIVTTTPNFQRVVMLRVVVSSASGATRSVPSEPSFLTCNAIFESSRVDGPVLDAPRPGS